MKIDLTGMDPASVAQLVQQFPQGQIITEDGRTYLVTAGNITPQTQVQQPTQRQPPQKNAFLRMFDAMGDYF